MLITSKRTSLSWPALHSVRSEMSIAVNASNDFLRSEERKGVAVDQSSRFPLLRTENEVFAVTGYKHLAPNEAKKIAGSGADGSVNLRRLGRNFLSTYLLT
jgi:hypothetical protein